MKTQKQFKDLPNGVLFRQGSTTYRKTNAYVAKVWEVGERWHGCWFGFRPNEVVEALC